MHVHGALFRALGMLHEKAAKFHMCPSAHTTTLRLFHLAEGHTVLVCKAYCWNCRQCECMVDIYTVCKQRDIQMPFAAHQCS